MLGVSLLSMTAGLSLYVSEPRVASALTPCAPVATGQLVAHWKFDEASGPTVQDSTSYNNTGSLLNGASRTSSGAPLLSSNPSALSLDGVNDHVLVPDTTNFPASSSGRTIALWMNQNAITNQATMLSMGNGNASGQKFILQMGTAGGQTYLFTDGVNSANNITLTGSQIPGVGWHHVAFTVTNNGNWKYFLDGVQKKTGNFPVNLNTVVNDVEIGSRHDLFNGFFQGRLDDVRIYRGTLTPNEVDILASGCDGVSTASSASSLSSLSSMSSLSSASSLSSSGSLSSVSSLSSASSLSSLSSLSSASSLSSVSSLSSLSSASSMSSSCTNVSTADLNGYWKFDEGTSTTANDSTSFNNSGSLLNGATWSVQVAPTNFANPTSLLLDGTNDFVRVLNTTGLPSGGAARTVATWMNGSASGAQATLVAMGNLDTSAQKFIVQMGKVAGQTYVFTDGINVINNVTLTGSQIPGAGWHHIAFSMNASGNWKYYLDGVLKKSGTFTVPINTNTNDVEIGSRHDNGFDGFFGGRLDDTRIYGRALTDTEVMNLAQGCGNISSSSASSQSSLSSTSASSMSSTSSLSQASQSSLSSTSASSQSSQSSQNSSLVSSNQQCDGVAATVFVQNGVIVGGPDNGQPYIGILRGTAGNDVIVGTQGMDLIGAKAGNDLVCGRAGMDRIYGDAGQDTIFGGNDMDIIDGNDGRDMIFGGNANDILLGSDGRDVLCGDNGMDVLTGGADGDRIDGGNGNDVIQGGPAFDACASGLMSGCEQPVNSIPEC